MDDDISQAPPAQESKFLRRSGRTSQSEAVAASEKYADELVRKRKLKRDAEVRQKNIGDVESGKKGSY
ncbi:hypothetical protein A2U01_0005768 [Trifolium medium]|uniref:Uncharacterized protein n=1 Tax=Trifolium medium TaxID=97028 RepID=A0A392MBN6_9FABA|nr:hypothetical protein [Trifolium medium]